MMQNLIQGLLILSKYTDDVFIKQDSIYTLKMPYPIPEDAIRLLDLGWCPHNYDNLQEGFYYDV